MRSPHAAPLPEDAGAFSMIAPVFGAVYGMWRDPAQDAAALRWLRGISAEAAPVTRGVYVGEADLAAPGRLAQAWSPAALSRLSALRARHDPEGRFRREIVQDGGEAIAAA